MMPVSHNYISSANFILEMVTSVVFLAFVSNKWWNNYSWPSLPLSFIFHSEIRPLPFTIVPLQIKFKKEKVARLSTPVDSVLLYKVM